MSFHAFTLKSCVAQLISWRFFDGSNVDVAEFLHFFTTPPASRQAKSAASVVRMSLDLLCLDSTDSAQVLVIALDL